MKQHLVPAAIAMLLLWGCSDPAERMARLLETEIESTLQPGDDAEKIEELIRSRGWLLKRSPAGYRGEVRDVRERSVVLSVAIRVDEKRRFVEATVRPPYTPPGS